MRTENLGGAGRNSPALHCETGILGRLCEALFERPIKTMLDAILILSNTDRIKAHEPGPHRFRFP
jgi:hypothetical protein